MTDLGNRQILDDGTVLCDDMAALEILYAGLDLSDAIMKPSRDLELYRDANGRLDAGFRDPIISDGPVYEGVDWYRTWVTPKEYSSIDVMDHCLSKCKSDAERDRVHMEMSLFEERNMLPVLRHLVYMVDHFRKHGIVWGVGRGSSVSSFVLYLIGINRINPLKFKLDIREFLK